MQKPGAPVVKESRHRDRLDKIRGEGVGELTFWTLGTARTFAAGSFVEYCQKII